MLKLAELQQSFIDCLDGKNNSILQYIKKTKHFTAIEHFAVYQNSTMGFLQKTLQDIYPVCLQLVGNEFFIVMIDHYIKKNPSFSPDLADYGLSFPDYIVTYKPANALPYLADVARIEWAWYYAYRGRQPEKINWQLLTSLEKTFEKIIFLLPLHSSLIDSKYPIHRIWELHKDIYQNDEKIILHEGEKYYFLIWRKGLEVRIDTLHKIEWIILKEIQAQKNLNELSIIADEIIPPLYLENLIPQLILRGWIADYQHNQMEKKHG